MEWWSNVEDAAPPVGGESGAKEAGSISESDAGAGNQFSPGFR